jgi:methyltransferase
VGLVALQRLAELWLAERNRRWALARGAKEYGQGHYPLFFILHLGWLLGWALEGSWRGQASGLWWLWLGVFLAAQGLRYWAIATLGPYWNTRILIVPGGRRIREGPYRYLRHPNYLAVSLELLALPLIFNAWITALAASLLNAWLLLRVRIPAEEAALGQYPQ